MTKRSDLDAMITKAITKREYKLTSILKDKKKYEDYIKEKNHKEVKKFASKFLSVPIMIGILASILMGTFYGSEKLIETLLSWTVGLTIIATILGLLEKYGKIN